MAGEEGFSSHFTFSQLCGMRTTTTSSVCEMLRSWMGLIFHLERIMVVILPLIEHNVKCPIVVSREKSWCPSSEVYPGQNSVVLLPVSRPVSGNMSLIPSPEKPKRRTWRDLTVRAPGGPFRPPRAGNPRSSTPGDPHHTPCFLRDTTAVPCLLSPSGSADPSGGRVGTLTCS